MAIVPRSYAATGPTDEMLDRYVSIIPAEVQILAMAPQVVVTINVDNAVPDLIATLDEYMATLGYTPTAPGTSAKQVFQHVVGAPGGDTLTIVLPAARASANYNVQITFGGPGGAANAIKIPRVIPSSFTPTQFDVELSAAVEAGDIFLVTVEDLT